MSKVLLADDSATMQKVVDLVLRDQGYEVVSAGTGEKAMELISSTPPPDLVLAYIKLPGMDGYQICQKVKSNPATRGIAVILLAGAFDPVDEAKKAEVGADGSIVKPFQAEDLLKVIQSHIGAAAPAAAAAPAGGDDIMFDGEDAGMSFADVAEAEPMEAEAFEAEPMAAEAFEAEAVAAEAFEAEAVEAEAFEAEPMEAEAFEAEPMMETEALVAETFSGDEYQAEAMEAEAFEAEPAMAAAPASAVAAAPAAAMPDASQMQAAIKQAVAEAISGVNLRAIIIDAMEPKIKEVLEKIAYDVVPELLDRTLRSNITDSLSAVNRELENIIWETVPDLAEAMLKKEMERIRQES